MSEVTLSDGDELGSLLVSAVEQSLYFQCSQGFVDLDSWVCLDKRFRRDTEPTKVIHMDTKYKFWYQVPVLSREVPSLNRYTEMGRQGRFNNYRLESNLNLLVEADSLLSHLSLNGIKIDNRMGHMRSFQDIECFNVKAFLESN